MQHVDPDRLALLALGEQVEADGHPDAELTGHLASCAACQQELRSLRATVELAQETIDLRAEPLRAPEGVWAGIAAELDLGRQQPGAPLRRVDEPVAQDPARQQSFDPARQQGPDPARPHDPGRPLDQRQPGDGDDAGEWGGRTGRHRRTERARGRWVRGAVALSAAAAVGVLGTLVAVRPWADDAPAVQAASSAELDPVTGGPAGVHGRATVVQGPDGPELRVTTTGLPLQNGFYQVWVFNGRDRMQAVGVLGKDSTATLPLPDTLDLRTYNVVDISSEPYDGDQTHSQDSVLRGTLTK